MKLIVLFLASVFAFNTFAGTNRTGTDERIHICQTDNEATPLGKNQKFRVHVIAGESIRLTRLSDKKWFTATPSINSSAYVFAKDKRAGNLWPKGKSGYLFDVEDNKMTVAHQVSPGAYENTRLTCELARVISELDPLSPTEAALQDIGEEAQLANGGYEVSKFNLSSFDKENEVVALEKMAKEWEGCTWTPMSDRQEILKMIRTTAFDPDAARKIKALEKKPGLLEVIAIISDDDISCSQRYVWIFTEDGYKLDLSYSQGD